MIGWNSTAQVSVNVNIGTPPLWGPVGYSDVRYYYLPDVEAYYDVHTSMFIYFGNGVWLRRSYLPSRYSGYDLYGGYKVVMPHYHGSNPYYNHSSYKVKYKKGYKGSPQKTIGAKPNKGGGSGYKKGSPSKPQQNNYKKGGGQPQKGGGGKPSQGGGGHSKGGGGKGGGKK